MAQYWWHALATRDVDVLLLRMIAVRKKKKMEEEKTAAEVRGWTD
jgi:hypothetical protein